MLCQENINVCLETKGTHKYTPYKKCTSVKLKQTKAVTSTALRWSGQEAVVPKAIFITNTEYSITVKSNTRFFLEHGDRQELNPILRSNNFTFFLDTELLTSVRPGFPSVNSWPINCRNTLYHLPIFTPVRWSQPYLNFWEFMYRRRHNVLTRKC
jgi:hypothetical protein